MTATGDSWSAVEVILKPSSTNSTASEELQYVRLVFVVDLRLGEIASEEPRSQSRAVSTAVRSSWSDYT
jgi:hypothetical protein